MIEVRLLDQLLMRGMGSCHVGEVLLPGHVVLVLGLDVAVELALEVVERAAKTTRRDLPGLEEVVRLLLGSGALRGALALRTRRGLLTRFDEDGVG